MPNKYYIANVIGYYDGAGCDSEIVFAVILGAFEDVESARADVDNYIKGIDSDADSIRESIHVFENHKMIKTLYRRFDFDYENYTYVFERSWE